MNLRAQQILKQKKVQEIKNLILEHDVFFLVSFQNMKVADIQNWKRTLYKEFGSENPIILRVYKNTLLKRALIETPYAQMKDVINKNFFVVAGKVDPLVLVKKFATLLNKKQKTKFLAGIYNQEFYSGTQMNELASLPTKEELIGQLILTLNFIPLNLLLTLQEISKKKSN